MAYVYNAEGGYWYDPENPATVPGSPGWIDQREAARQAQAAESSHDDAGTITAAIGEDDLPLLTITSKFGIGDDGPYFDPAGAVTLEAALLTLDPTDGSPVLTKLNGGF